MSHEDEVIDAVQDGLERLGLSGQWTPELERLFRLVFRAGMLQEKVQQLEGELEQQEMPYELD